MSSVDQNHRGPESQGGEHMGELSRERSLRVLIADDNEDAAEMLAQLVRMRGYQVAVAHDGLEAISSAASFMPDVALLDIGMPELDGHQVAAELRKERGSDVTLVAITGWGDGAAKER